MISFEMTDVSFPKQSALEVKFDEAGLDSIIARLMLIKNGATEHIDLFSMEWGGGDLEVRGLGGINHVKFMLVDFDRGI